MTLINEESKKRDTKELRELCFSPEEPTILHVCSQRLCDLFLNGSELKIVNSAYIAKR